jgi:hypothetical protein
LATIRKRGKRWQVQVRRHGEKPVCRSFPWREDALGWARTIESEMDRGAYVDHACLADLMRGDLLTRYRDTVSIHKLRNANEKIILNAMITRPFASRTLDRVDAEVTGMSE